MTRMKTIEERLRASCAMCGGNLSNPTIYEGDTYRYVEVRGCCYDVEFYAPPGFKLDQYPYGEPLSEWPEDFQSEVILQLNTRARTDAALSIVADAPRIYRGEEIKELPYNTRGVDGLCESTGEMAWKEITIAGWSAALIDAHKEKGMTRLFLPLPTNSPSEGQ